MATFLLSSYRPRFTSHLSPSEVSLLDIGIQGVDGAHKVFAELQSRKAGTVTSLRVAYNPLGDAGAIALFDLLAQAGGDAYPLETLELDNSWIGNEGLRAAASYLLGNTRLRKLNLLNNWITGDDEAMTVLFVEAINSSRLEILSLSSNALTDAFATPFFRALASRTLSTLHLSNVAFTPPTASLFASHLISPTSPQYTDITLNANSLSQPGVKAIVGAASTRQFRITRLELYANWDTPEGEEQWIEMRRIFTRNDLLRRQTREQAVCLLRCARAALFRPLGTPTLPTELVLLAMAHLSPRLSFNQRERVLDYARDPRTLPPARAQTPALPPLSREQTDVAKVWKSPFEIRSEERERFLVHVGCDAFDAEGYTHED